MAEDQDKKVPKKAKAEEEAVETKSEKAEVAKPEKAKPEKAKPEKAKPEKAKPEKAEEAKPEKAVETKSEKVEEAKPEKAETPEKVDADKKPAPSAAGSDAVQEAKDILGGGDDVLPEVKPVAKGRKAKAPVPMGVAHVKATFNNTMVSITDLKGGVVAWSSAGKAGFKGSRKSTAFAATLVAQDAARQAMARGMREVEVRVQGAGSGRESAVRALQSVGLNISLIKDVTPVPHNGCRAKKRRRV